MIRRGSSSVTLLVLVVSLALLAAACSDGEPGTASLSRPADNDGPPALDELRVESGQELYSPQCAVCHGADLQGDPDWKTPNADGSFRPPPQNASGHTWHHPDQLLVEIIREGSGSTLSAMPLYGDILTQDEILSIIEFFKSTWGSEERLFQWERTRATQES